jgi:Family of unknown function (DUF6502)
LISRIVPKKIEAVDPIREATIDALKHVVDSLLELMFDTGITVQQFNYIVRDRAVRAATNRVITETGRNSKSRVAIITGLPRSEVTKISSSSGTCVKTRLGQPAARRILAAWFEKPSLLSESGEPATLPIFGKRGSFERLVSVHGGGAPVRAMLDELIQLDAIERVGDQWVRAKSRTPVSVGLTPVAIAAIGERCSDLMQTLMKNLRRADTPLFEATSTEEADAALMPMIRREMSRQGATFISSANSFLKRARRTSGISATQQRLKSRVGVTLYYFEDTVVKSAPTSDARKPGRTNLRRTRSKKPK